jgi:hypothetical protein
MKPGGRFRVSDIVLLQEPSPEKREDLERWAACAAGALLPDDFEGRLRQAGFQDAAVHVKGRFGEAEFASAYIEARKSSPGEAAPTEAASAASAPAGGERTQRRGCC